MIYPISKFHSSARNLKKKKKKTVLLFIDKQSIDNRKIHRPKLYACKESVYSNGNPLNVVVLTSWTVNHYDVCVHRQL